MCVNEPMDLQQTSQSEAPPCCVDKWSSRPYLIIARGSLSIDNKLLASRTGGRFSPPIIKLLGREEFARRIPIE